MMASNEAAVLLGILVDKGIITVGDVAEFDRRLAEVHAAQRAAVHSINGLPEASGAGAVSASEAPRTSVGAVSASEAPRTSAGAVSAPEAPTQDPTP
jgi:hypothetical protein